MARKTAEVQEYDSRREIELAVVIERLTLYLEVHAMTIINIVHD